MSSRTLYMAMIVALASIIGLGASAQAQTLSLSASDTVIDPGESFQILFNVDDATGVAGAALTIAYDGDAFGVDDANESGEDYFLVGSDMFILVTDSRQPPGTPEQAVPSVGNMDTEPEKVLLSGAYVDPTNGGAAYTGMKALFKVGFAPDMDATPGFYTFTGMNSEIFNPDAGWGTDVVKDEGDFNPGEGDTKETVPALVGAVASGEPGFDNFDCSGYPGTPCAFPPLINDFIAVTTEVKIPDGDLIEDNYERSIWGDLLNVADDTTDHDFDGFPDNVEQPPRPGFPGNGQDPETPDPPGGEGYNAETDTRLYEISGSVTYDGEEEGIIYITLSDSSSLTPVMDSMTVDSTSQPGPWPYTFTDAAAKNTYYVGAFMDVDGNEERDPEDPSGKVAVPMSPDLSGNSIALALGETFDLKAGWNLMSINVDPVDDSVPTVLADIDGKYTIVWGEFDPETEQWKNYNPVKPINQLTSIKANNGYWIYVTEDCSFFVAGSQAVRSVDLKVGWNLIGFSGDAETVIEDILDSIAGQYSIVWGEFNPETEQWKNYNPVKPVNQLTHMKPGFGYWIDATEETTLDY